VSYVKLFAERLTDKCGGVACMVQDEYCTCKAWAEERAEKPQFGRFGYRDTSYQGGED
jgi:hypothetical protein